MGRAGRAAGPVAVERLATQEGAIPTLLPNDQLLGPYYRCEITQLWARPPLRPEFKRRLGWMEWHETWMGLRNAATRLGLQPVDRATLVAALQDPDLQVT